MTRTRGWCFLTGTGKKASAFFDEIGKILSEGPERVTFEVPDPKTIQRNLDNLEYEKRRNKMKKAQDYKDKLKQLLAEVNDPGFRKAILEDLQTTDSAGGC
jgi:superfamily I DNA and RNA helicase